MRRKPPFGLLPQLSRAMSISATLIRRLVEAAARAPARVLAPRPSQPVKENEDARHGDR
jgi:hypothetical protein